MYKEVRCQSEQILEIRETTKYNTEKYMNVYRIFDCFTYAIEWKMVQTVDRTGNWACPV